MASKKKIEAVSRLLQEIRNFGVIAFADYSHITHQQLEELRNQVRQQGGLIRVVKNSLISRALVDAGFEPPALTGPTLMVLTTDASLTPLSLIHQKAKEFETLSFKAGVWNTRVVDSETIMRLATLPGIDLLRARLVGQLQSPLVRTVLSLKGNLQKLAVILKSRGGDIHGRIKTGQTH